MFSPDIHDKIDGKMYIMNKNNIKQLKYAYNQKHYEIKDILKFDLNKGDEPGQAEYQKHSVIKWLCQIFQIPDTVDRNVIITDEIIRNNMEVLIQQHKNLKLLFNLQSKPPNSFKAVIAMVRSVIKSWSGSSLDKASENLILVNNKYERRYTYKLSPPSDSFDFLLENMVYKRVPDIVRQLQPGELDFPEV